MGEQWVENPGEPDFQRVYSETTDDKLQPSHERVVR